MLLSSCSELLESLASSYPRTTGYIDRRLASREILRRAYLPRKILKKENNKNQTYKISNLQDFYVDNLWDRLPSSWKIFFEYVKPQELGAWIAGDEKPR